ncbi:hypothetical protein [Granulicella arctica]|uniref:Uncharacterized protein n=1 Tax=Granulicella arctica TaxID=940613 RepID=A0A7Y9PEM2_9BACT|nr:hypothetical protein [Granulicella arctica]NYF78500.1 hypothetical protein [Granulicella arctica]
MRTILLVLTLVAVGYVAINRQRIYVRDPLGAVYRNEAKVDGAKVFINYSNDVLLQMGDGMQMEEYLVQGWNKMPGTPTELRCLQGLVCLTEADHAPMEPSVGASEAAMTNREVSFAENRATTFRITLR